MFDRKRSPLAFILAAVLTLTSVVSVAVAPTVVTARAVELDIEGLGFTVAMDDAEHTEDKYHVRVNGVPLTEDPSLTIIENATYVSLRTMAQAILPGCAVEWHGGHASVTMAGVLDLTARPGLTYLVANGRYLHVPGKIQTKEGAVLVPLHTLAKAMDATVLWQADGSLDIVTGSGGILSGDKFYNAEDLNWLSRIINAESGNQPLAGKMAVGNVVLNRVKSSKFPNTVKAVVCQKNQFSPVANGTINRNPNAESVLAAKLCLDGGVALYNVLYFNRVGVKSWASRHRSLVATIGGHSFYG